MAIGLGLIVFLLVTRAYRCRMDLRGTGMLWWFAISAVIGIYALFFWYLYYMPKKARLFINARQKEILHEELPLLAVDGFLSNKEIQRFMEIGASRLAPSRVVSARETGKVPYRTSQSAHFFFPLNYHPLFYRVRCRAAALARLPASHVESLQICRYREGESFGLHFDYFQGRASVPQAAGQRVATILVYLSDAPDGGGQTVFPQLDFTVLPFKGMAVYWPNLLEDGTPNYKTLHEGRPVKGGRDKWIMNIWIREKPLLPHFLVHYVLRALRLR